MRRALALFALVLVVAAFGRAASTAASSIVAGGEAGCIRRAVTGATSEAALKITFEDGRTVEYCIEFSEPEITGADLLFRTGLPVVTALNGGLGAAVCSIDGEGCNDPGDCFCKCRGGTCAYWAYFQRKNGAWVYSQQGAGLRTIRDGDADAWFWGSGTSSPGAAVDCAEPTPTVTSTPPPTASATHPATRTPLPEATDAPDTPVPTSSRSTPTAAAPGADTSTPAAPASAAPQSAATHTPSSGVLGAVTGATAVPATSSASPGTPSPGGSATVIASPTKARTATGAIRISEAEGQRNAERLADGGGWSWGSIGMFGAAVVVIGAVAGGVMWRRRGTR